jgi:hypothetical protein
VYANTGHLMLITLAQEDDNDNIQLLLEDPIHFDILLSPIENSYKKST